MVFACSTLLLACADGDTTGQAEPVAEPESVVEVTASHDPAENLHRFEMSSREVSSGWTTLRFTNASPYDHFFLIWQVPEEGIAAAEAAGEPLLEHWFQAVAEPFQHAFDPFIAGDIDYETFVDDLMERITENGSWFFDPGAPPMGGPGFTAAGLTSETTVQLEPGEYIAECYVRDEDDVFHSYIGMLEHVTVTDERSGVEEPDPSVELRISSTDGIQVDEALEPGSHVVEVFFEDQATYDHMQGHNVQLVRLDDGNDEAVLDELADWMDWRQDGSLVDRAPDGARFIGGVMEMAEGATAYFHVELEAGDYAWIAEVPDPAGHGMLETFTVGPGAR